VAKLFIKNKPFIGLDISLTGVKVMSIASRRGRVQGYGSLDLDPAEVQKALDDPENTYLADSISSLLSEHIVGSLGSDYVVLGIPTGRTFSRTFTLPAKEESKLNNALEIEVDQYIPIPMSALYVDHEVIERTKDSITVIMSAVPQALIDTCVKAVE
jgi:type IV pilus assembly protein PilM